jgi:hypothetical protein
LFRPYSIEQTALMMQALRISPLSSAIPAVRFARRAYAGSGILDPEIAFEMASATVRFGRGVTKEVGQDLVAMGLTRRVCVMTDPYMATLQPFRTVLESLTKAQVDFEVCIYYLYGTTYMTSTYMTSLI